jgi:hypothetical protein
MSIISIIAVYLGIGISVVLATLLLYQGNNITNNENILLFIKRNALFFIILVFIWPALFVALLSADDF